MNDDKRPGGDFEITPVPSFEDDPAFNAGKFSDSAAQYEATAGEAAGTAEFSTAFASSFEKEDDLAATKRVGASEFVDDDLRIERREPQKKSQPKKKSIGKKRLPSWAKTVIWLGTMALVIVILAGTLITVAKDVYGLGKGDSDNPAVVEIYVDKGDTLYDIIDILGDEGVVQNKIVFKAFIKLKKIDATIQYGLHTFKDTMDYSAILDELRTQTEFKDVVNVTVKEGMSVDEIGALLEEKKVCTAAELVYAIRNEEFTSALLDSQAKNDNIYYNIEGYLYPDTYQFYLGSTGKMVIQKMLDRMEEMFTSEMRTKANDMGWSYHDVLTLASIVEEEANGLSDIEKQKVAAVFINRLNWTTEPRFLGSDPTVAYSKTHDSNTAHYNTYASGGYEGLPPGPICSPTQSSISAVLNHNENFNYYYFYSKDGKIYYSKTYAEHQAIIKKYS